MQEPSVQIIDYTSNYAQAFRDINEEWIQHYFVMEAGDYKALDDPQASILDPGGSIFMALYQGEPVGTVAMVKMENDTYELAKMGVRPIGQGRGVASQLVQTVIDKAKAVGAKRLYLECNTKLHAALHVYEKAGFVHLQPTKASAYARADVQMELWL